MPVPGPCSNLTEEELGEIMNTPLPRFDSPWHQSSLRLCFLQPQLLFKANRMPPEFLDPWGSAGAAVLGADHFLEFSEPSVLSISEKRDSDQPASCAWVLTDSPTL